jgi:glutamate-5-semialdehyde dehydrogenase
MAMCVRSGNVCILRGGKEWFLTNSSLMTVLQEAAESQGIPAGALTFIDRPEKEGVLELTRLPKFINGVIPRGKAGLRKAILEQSRVPVLGYDGGLCHVYIDREAELPLAQGVVVNSKIQDPLASNAADTLLVHQGISRQLLPGLLRRLLSEFKIDLIGCPKTVSVLGFMEMTGHKAIEPAKEEDWGQKVQSSRLAIKVVANMDEAIDHISAYGPGHTDTIVTRDYDTAMRFVREVDSSAVLVNASTRLHAGSELGLGSEIGMNTTHFHIRGPLTLQSLTVEKVIGFGTGQLRHPHPVPREYEDAMMLSAKF